MRSTSRCARLSALTAGMLVAGASMLAGTAGAAVQDQAGVPAASLAPPVEQAGQDVGPVSPRSHTFRHCGNRRVCIFRGANFRTWKVTFRAQFAGAWRWILVSDGVARRHYSAKNRFGNRRLLLRGTRANGTWRRFCLNPKTNRRGPLGPGMLQFKIGARGSRC